MIHDTDFHSLRRLGVGGSDVAAILGVSAWATPLEIYLEKRGEGVAQREREAMDWGKRLEPVVRQAYADRTGYSVVVPTEPIVHPVHPFMRANVDGLVQAPTADRGYEGKIARFDEDWGEEGTDEIPLPYLFQCNHYMAVTGRPRWDVGVLIGGSEFRIYTVHADPDITAMLIEAEREFWQRVQDGNPPEPSNIADALLRWGRVSKSKTAVAGAEDMAAIGEMRRLNFEIKRLQDLAEDEKLKLMGTMQSADRLVHVRGGTLATWRTHLRDGEPVRTFRLK